MRTSYWDRCHTNFHENIPFYEGGGRYVGRHVVGGIVGGRYLGCRYSQVGLAYYDTIIHLQNLVKLFKKYWDCDLNFGSIFFYDTHIDQMLIFEDVWIVATTQTAKYGRFDKTSLVQYTSGWCRFGVVHVKHACATTNHHISCMCQPTRAWSLVRSHYLSKFKKIASKCKAAFQNKVSLKSVLCIITHISLHQNLSSADM